MQSIFKTEFGIQQSLHHYSCIHFTIRLNTGLLRLSTSECVDPAEDSWGPGRGQELLRVSPEVGHHLALML